MTAGSDFKAGVSEYLSVTEIILKPVSDEWPQIIESNNLKHMCSNGSRFAQQQIKLRIVHRNAVF